MSSFVAPFKNQQYFDLKNYCIKNKKLFEDPEFPANNSSLFYRQPPRSIVEWKRPGEISSDPRLFVEGINSHDLNQGDVGNCWFVAASSCLALKPNIWEKVIPDWEEQDWDSKHPESYAGIFHFRFWVFGQWTDVVVDDQLPTINRRLIYCHSNSHNEFWSALLEKAYAKLYGCYESLKGGNTGDAVVDFSGAVCEPINLEEEAFYKDKEKQNHLFEKLLDVYKHGGIISCSIKAERYELESKLANGLVMGHAYSVTAVNRVRLGHGQRPYSKTETIPMIRMRNPWGQKEWNGPWSDSSEEWSTIDYAERNNLGLTVEDDGEFWMSFKDWCRYFSYADVCHIVDPSLTNSRTWNEALHFGSWTRHDDPVLNRSGGYNSMTVLQNPQYVFDVTKKTDEVMITLQQKDRRIHKKTGHGKNVAIGFGVYEVESNRKCRINQLWNTKQMGSAIFSPARSVFMRYNLPKGRYVVIPSTLQAGVQGQFMLRIFTDEDSSCRELTGEEPKKENWSMCIGNVGVVIYARVKNAEGLENQDNIEANGTDSSSQISTPMPNVQELPHIPPN